MLKKISTLFFVAAALSTLTACPGPDDDTPCTDAEGQAVTEDECTDENGDLLEGCTCEADLPECGDGVCDEGEDADSCEADCGGEGPICGDGTCDEGEDADSCADDCAEAPAFRFVLLEDLTENTSGDFPGADIDAIGLIKGDGSGEVFASSVEEESDVSCEGGNTACDTNALTGAPDVVIDGVCFGGGQPNGDLFTALNKGHVIVGFGENIIENGDAIHVYEIGATECGRFDDDPFKVSVSITDLLDGPFIELAVGEGDNIAQVTGL